MLEISISSGTLGPRPAHRVELRCDHGTKQSLVLPGDVAAHQLEALKLAVRRLVAELQCKCGSTA